MTGDESFDVVHDHCGFTALAMADRIQTPLVHTLHGPFTPSTAAFYARHGHKAALVGISRAQLSFAPPGLRPVGAIPNPIAIAEWPLRGNKDDFLLWVGRMTPTKGPHRAIAAARIAGLPLVLAGIVQPEQRAFFDSEVAPHIDGKAVRFVGEVDGPLKRSLFSRARGLLMPIRWNEPFGMVMIEAMACGTPVIAFSEGAAPELIVDGKTGFLVTDEAAMAAAVDRLSGIAPRACRDWVAEHCDVDAVAAAYERTYRSVARRAGELRGICLVAPERAGRQHLRGRRSPRRRASRRGTGARLLREDTRFISQWVLGASKVPLEVLSLDQSRHFDAQFVLAPDVGPDDQIPYSIVRRRLIDHLWIEEVTVTNHLHQTVELDLTLEVDCDFADLFEVKDGEVAEREVAFGGEAQIALGYRHGDFPARHRRLEPAGSITRSGFASDPNSAAGERWSTTFTVDPEGGIAAPATGSARRGGEMGSWATTKAASSTLARGRPRARGGRSGAGRGPTARASATSVR